MVIGSGEADCGQCGYKYDPKVGDPEFPIPAGTKFEDVPDDYICAVCGAPKSAFTSRLKEVAGFAPN